VRGISPQDEADSRLLLFKRGGEDLRPVFQPLREREQVTTVYLVYLVCLAYLVYLAYLYPISSLLLVLAAH